MSGRRSVGVMFASIRSFLFVWWLVSYAPLYLVLLLMFTFGEMRLLIAFVPWLRGFRLSLVCSCRLHDALHEEVIMVHGSSCCASSLTSFLLGE
jgi:hypothetical protein